MVSCHCCSSFLPLLPTGASVLFAGASLCGHVHPTCLSVSPCVLLMGLWLTTPGHMLVKCPYYACQPDNACHLHYNIHSMHGHHAHNICMELLDLQCTVSCTPGACLFTCYKDDFIELQFTVWNRHVADTCSCGCPCNSCSVVKRVCGRAVWAVWAHNVCIDPAQLQGSVISGHSPATCCAISLRQGYYVEPVACTWIMK